MNIHLLAVPQSLDSLHTQNQNLGWQEGGKLAHRKHRMEWVEPVGKRKLVVGNRRSTAEVTPISALAGKMPSPGEGTFGPRRQTQSWPEGWLSRAPEHGSLCPQPGPEGRKRRGVQINSIFATGH